MIQKSPKVNNLVTVKHIFQLCKKHIEMNLNIETHYCRYPKTFWTVEDVPTVPIYRNLCFSEFNLKLPLCLKLPDLVKLIVIVFN